MNKQNIERFVRKFCFGENILIIYLEDADLPPIVGGQSHMPRPNSHNFNGIIDIPYNKFTSLSESDQKGILLHELGHIVLHHSKKINLYSREQLEFEAQMFGILVCEKYNMSSVKQVLIDTFTDWNKLESTDEFVLIYKNASKMYKEKHKHQDIIKRIKNLLDN